MDENSNNTPLDSMTVQENNQGNIAGEEAIVEVEKKETKGNKGLMVIIFILLFAVIAMGTYIFIKEGYFSEKTSTNTVKEEEEKKKEETVKEPELVKFEGKYLYAEVPQGWSVKEYEEFLIEGKPYKDNDFHGLGTFNIYKENKEMLHLGSVFYVPQPGVPDELRGKIFRFKDYSPEKEVESVKELEEWLEVWNQDRIEKITLEIVDYTNVKYSEFKILGGTLRRVGNILFQDAQRFDNTTFEASASRTLYNFAFPCTTPTVGTYYKFAEGITEPDLLIIDKILQSLKPNCSE